MNQKTVIRAMIPALVTELNAIPANEIPAGWRLFNADDPLTMGIERLDEEGLFADDINAMINAATLAAVGNRYATLAVTLHTLADQLRGLTWGFENANRRIMPDSGQRVTAGKLLEEIRLTIPANDSGDRILTPDAMTQLDEMAVGTRTALELDEDGDAVESEPEN